MSAEENFNLLGLELPPAPTPIGVYIPLLIHGKLCYVSGHGPLLPDKSLIRGRVGVDIDPEQGKLAAVLREWRDRSVAAFLAAYRGIPSNRRLWPADPRAAERALNFFLLEKAFCEIEYELAYRPDWLRVPLSGMLRILSQQSNEAS